MVTNGVYATGGKAFYGAMTNRVTVDRPLTLASVNGPKDTIIVGAKGSAGATGDGAVRCVYLTNGTVLSGFTLTNGATRSTGDFNREQSGGGVFCAAVDALVTNCTLAANSASFYGGGAYGGTLNRCLLAGNSSTRYGGGAYQTGLTNCLLTGNSASSGGGAYQGSLNNCTITGNLASSGGGSCMSTANNCLIYYNKAELGTNDYGGTLNYCCTTPLPADGAGNITTEPQLGSPSHLSVSSPCRQAGSADYAAFGRPRRFRRRTMWNG